MSGRIFTPVNPGDERPGGGGGGSRRSKKDCVRFVLIAYKQKKLNGENADGVEYEVIRSKAGRKIQSGRKRLY